MVFFSLCVDLCWFIWLSCGCYHWLAAEAAGCLWMPESGLRRRGWPPRGWGSTPGRRARDCRGRATSGARPAPGVTRSARGGPTRPQSLFSHWDPCGADTWSDTLLGSWDCPASWTGPAWSWQTGRCAPHRGKDICKERHKVNNHGLTKFYFHTPSDQHGVEHHAEAPHVRRPARVLRVGPEDLGGNIGGAAVLVRQQVIRVILQHNRVLEWLKLYLSPEMKRNS